MHLSADRKRSYAISIPRDSIVDRPECEDSAAATDVMWNAAYSEGKALCTVAQFEQNTDILVDHFVVIDFNGFGEMVDAVDGVPVCVPEPIVDKAHQIYVPAGDPSILSGDEALDYVRARYVGELAQQNDLSRIKRQQTFIAALIRKVKSAGTLTRLDRVVGFSGRGDPFPGDRRGPRLGDAHRQDRPAAAERRPRQHQVHHRADGLLPRSTPTSRARSTGPRRPTRCGS
ncbi:LCP family protein [Nocardioides sp. B-3]|nr:LCP family protein [Nocardioides sp. B-3]